jgi:hypothetical protein
VLPVLGERDRLSANRIYFPGKYVIFTSYVFANAGERLLLVSVGSFLMACDPTRW